MVVWPSVRRRTQTQNGWHDWFLDSRSSRYYGLNISAIETPMAKPTCRDVYNDKTHMLHEGFDDLTQCMMGNNTIKQRHNAAETAGTANTVKMMISLSSWILLPWNFSGVCAKVENTLWLKDMITGVMDHREYTCQPAETLLRDSRDIMHKNIYNSFILSSMAIKI